MNWKYFGCILIGIVIGYTIQNINFIKKFRPSAATCGAAISRNKITIGTFSRGIECLKAGYKDVYFGNISNVLFEYIPDEYAKKEIQLIPLSEASFILYTKKVNAMRVY